MLSKVKSITKKYAIGGTVKADGKRTNNAKKGGLFEGRSHAEGGIKAVNVDTDQPIEVEGNEVIINKKSVADDTLHTFNGKKMTNREILSEINQSGGGVAFEKGGETDSEKMEDDELVQDAKLKETAESVARYKYFERNVQPNYEEKELVDLADNQIKKIAEHLFSEAKEKYEESNMFRMQVNQKGSKGINSMYMYMERWADDYIDEINDDDDDDDEYERGGSIDADRYAKPMGWRWKDSAVEDGLISKAALSKSPSAKMRKDYPEYVYYEDRQDKSDKVPSRKYQSLEEGGEISKYDKISSDVYAKGGTINDYQLTTTEIHILSQLGNSTLNKCQINKNKLKDISNIQESGIVYIVPSKHKDCYEVRLTDFGVELVKDAKFDYDHSKFEKGGEMDCGCQHSKYKDGGTIENLPPITFDISSKEEGKRLHQEVIKKTGGNKFSISQQGDKDKYYAYDTPTFEIIDELWRERKGIEKFEKEEKYFKGIDAKYKNQFEINKAIEEFIENKGVNELTPAERNFIGYYAGYGGLEKFGASGKGLLYEYFTPTEIAKKMWGLAYKYGYKGGKILEPSCGIGEFMKYAPSQDLITGYEINKVSAKICKVLYPNAKIESKYFETLFIKNNSSIKNNISNLPKYSLVIGNPPYGKMGGIYAGMGEKDYTKANNYIDYFISRGLDLLEKDGLLIFIIGTEVAAGGTPFLQQPMTPAKKMIAEKSILVDAYRLPNGLFEATDVVTDIIVLKKK